MRIFFEERYRMLLEKYRFEVETQSTEHLDFQELSDQLDSAFLARKLWQAVLCTRTRPYATQPTILACWMPRCIISNRPAFLTTRN
jgi:hypothetical protein